MPRVCTVCHNPHRHEIDMALASSEAPRRRIAARYGLPETCLRRHARRCLPDSLIEAVRASQEAERVSALEHSTWLVTKLREQAELTSVRPDQFLEVADRLDRSIKTYGLLRKEIVPGGDRVTNLFLDLGVRDERELKDRMSILRGASETPPEQIQAEAIEALRLVWRTKPELRYAALEALETSSFAEVTDGSQNGNAKS